MPALSHSCSLFYAARYLLAMSLSQASTPVGEHAHGGNQSELYFAYGSNMAVEQMARRCPTSVFIGTARLDGYRWQINKRGVANIVCEAKAAAEEQSRDRPYLQGLVYRVQPADVQSLDRGEGVRRQLYQKHILTVDVQEVSGYTGHLCTQLAPRLAQALRDKPGADGRLAPTNDDAAGLQAEAEPAPYKHNALVYISDNFTLQGHIRDEYIARMGAAIQCGVALGMSPDYVNKAIAPYLLDDNAGASVETAAGLPRDAAVSAEDGSKMDIDGPEPQVSATASGTTHVRNATAKKDTATAALCGSPACSHRGPLCDLRTENRAPHSISGTRFDGAIFDRLCEMQNGVDPGKDTAGDDTDKRTAPARLRSNVQLVFSVVLEEPTIVTTHDHAAGVSEDTTETAPRSSPGYSVEATAKTMAVAAELALKYFRDSLARFNVPVHGGIIGPPVLDELQIIYEPGATDRAGECICAMGDDSLYLSVQLPRSRGGGSIRVWTTQTELLGWE